MQLWLSVSGVLLLAAQLCSGLTSYELVIENFEPECVYCSSEMTVLLEGPSNSSAYVGQVLFPWKQANESSRAVSIPLRDSDVAVHFRLNFTGEGGVVIENPKELRVSLRDMTSGAHHFVRRQFEFILFLREVDSASLRTPCSDHGVLVNFDQPRCLCDAKRFGDKCQFTWDKIFWWTPEDCQEGSACLPVDVSLPKLDFFRQKLVRLFQSRMAAKGNEGAEVLVDWNQQSGRIYFINVRVAISGALLSTDDAYRLFVASPIDLRQAELDIELLIECTVCNALAFFGNLTRIQLIMGFVVVIMLILATIGLIARFVIARRVETGAQSFSRLQEEFGRAPYIINTAQK